MSRHQYECTTCGEPHPTLFGATYCCEALQDADEE